MADRNAGQGFAAGIVAPTEIIVEGSGLASNREGLVRLEEQIDSADGVAMVVGPREAPDDLAEGIVISESGNAARYAVVFDAPAVGGEAIDDLETPAGVHARSCLPTPASRGRRRRSPETRLSLKRR